MTKTILIVDDADMVIKLTSFKLKAAGYTVLTGVDGADALKHFNGNDIDLVITDLHMPNKDGLELIQEIRNKSYYKFIPVVLFVSDPSINISEFIQSSQATILFNKDSINSTLVPTVKKIIG